MCNFFIRTFYDGKSRFVKIKKEELNAKAYFNECKFMIFPVCISEDYACRLISICIGYRVFGINKNDDVDIELMDEYNTPIYRQDFVEIVQQFCALNPFTIKINIKANNKDILVTSQVR